MMLDYVRVDEDEYKRIQGDILWIAATVMRMDLRGFIESVSSTAPADKGPALLTGIESLREIRRLALALLTFQDVVMDVEEIREKRFRGKELYGQATSGSIGTGSRTGSSEPDEPGP